MVVDECGVGLCEVAGIKSSQVQGPKRSTRPTRES
jgi:hypothetical protein